VSHRNLKIGMVQQVCSADTAANLEASIAGIEYAAGQGAQLLLLQELHGSLYFCQTEDSANFSLAEPVPGPLTETLGEVAADLGVVIVASVFEKRAAGLYHNTAVVLDADGRLAGRYRKMHIPDDPGFYEKFYFTPGDLGFTPIDTAVGRLGVLVCWDQWYPEAARLMALAGAEVLTDERLDASSLLDSCYSCGRRPTRWWAVRGGVERRDLYAVCGACFGDWHGKALRAAASGRELTRQEAESLLVVISVQED